MPRIAWVIFMAAVVWAVIYDTLYAMVDREDDLKIGVRSTAIAFADMDRVMIGILQLLMLAALALVGRTLHFGSWFYGGLGVAAATFVYQQWLIRDREPQRCLQAFLNNNYTGIAIFAGILLQYLYALFAFQHARVGEARGFGRCVKFKRAVVVLFRECQRRFRGGDRRILRRQSFCNGEVAVCVREPGTIGVVVELEQRHAHGDPFDVSAHEGRIESQHLIKLRQDFLPNPRCRRRVWRSPRPRGLSGTYQRRADRWSGRERTNHLRV